LPDVAVTVIVNVPPVPVHDKLEFPLFDNTILVGFNVQDSPGGVERTDNETVPVNPFRLVSLTVDIPLLPELMYNDVGVALIVKSVTCKIKLAV
jgi:hypothetical protein